jgi:hypothetical protein
MNKTGLPTPKEKKEKEKKAKQETPNINDHRQSFVEHMSLPAEPSPTFDL